MQGTGENPTPGYTLPMSGRYNATRATLFALANVLEESHPHSAELARAKVILLEDELWSAPPVAPAPSTGATSGEHAFSVRYRPPRMSGDWRVVLVSAVVSLAAQWAPQFLTTIGQSGQPQTAPDGPTESWSIEEP